MDDGVSVLPKLDIVTGWRRREMKAKIVTKWNERKVEDLI